MFIASGFLWRVIAGAIAIDVKISPWLITCTAFLALFLGFNKRRGELMALGDSGTRKNLKDYNLDMLQEYQNYYHQRCNYLLCPIHRIGSPQQPLGY